MKMTTCILATCALLLTATVIANDLPVPESDETRSERGSGFDIPWYSINSGGELLSVGGNFELSGTIGQWDATGARELSGGPWELTGGFWGLTLEELADLLFQDRFEE